MAGLVGIMAACDIPVKQAPCFLGKPVDATGGERGGWLGRFFLEFQDLPLLISPDQPITLGKLLVPDIIWCPEIA